MIGSCPLEHVIAEKIGTRGLVLFDDECGFCSFWVRFIIARDHRKHFVFAPLRAEWARGLRESAQELGDETVLFYTDGCLYSRSEAVLQIARNFSFPWNLVWLCRFIPRVIRDRVYRLIAKNRYRIFQRGACLYPSHQDTERFISL